MTAKTVQPYHPKDGDALAWIHNKSFPAERIRPHTFFRYLAEVIDVQGQVWTISDESGPVGYGCVTPVPGLEAIFHLQGCIDPDKRRQGFGTHLLNAILASFMERGKFQLSHAVYSLSSPAARFLLSRQFVVEHIEWQLLLENPGQFSAVSFSPAFRLATYHKAEAVRSFRKLYDAAFRGLPWYQPYTSAEEVTAELPDPANLLFLLDGEKTAGFAWLRMPEPDVGEIEPFGLLPAYRGKGLGVPFLIAAIQQLAAKGAKRVRIGAWQQNERAIRLYQQIGFKHVNTQTYLAYNSNTGT
ncbi:MAG: GNAT family N-acetyltransferase [Candidatus Promineifilaceae bacterium]